MRLVLAAFAVITVRERETDLGDDISASWKASGIPYAFAAGLSFALFFVFLNAADRESAVWPLLGTRGASVRAMAVIGSAGGRSTERAPASRAAMGSGGAAPR